MANPRLDINQPALFIAAAVVAVIAGVLLFSAYYLLKTQHPAAGAATAMAGLLPLIIALRLAWHGLRAAAPLPADAPKNGEPPFNPGRVPAATHAAPASVITPPPMQDINALLEAFNRGQHARAVTLAAEMTRRFPNEVFGWKVRGASLMSLGRNEEALSAMRQAAAVSPRDAEICNNLGFLLQHMGDREEAEHYLRTAIRLKPAYPEAYFNLGKLLQEMGRLADAKAAFLRAAKQNARAQDAYNGLGIVQLRMGEFADAESSFRRAIKLQPGDAKPHSNLGNALHGLRRLQEAESSIRQAIALNPDFLAAYVNLGNVLRDAGRFAEAEEAYRRAQQLNPDFAETYSNLGVVLSDLGRHDEAVVAYRRALVLNPGSPSVHSNLIFTLELSESESVASIQAECRAWGDRHAAPLLGSREFKNTADPDRRLRIGYISPDLRDHSGTRILAALMLQYDRTQYEVFAYSNASSEDAVTRRLKDSVTGWRNIVGQSDEAVADLVLRDKIDILVDLGAHTANSRLLVMARKPAPLQATINGTGIRAIDCLFADDILVPAAEQSLYAETVRYVPCFLPYTLEPPPSIPVTPLPALVHKAITWGCLNRLSKITPRNIALWIRILHAVPDSRLLFKSPEFSDVSVCDRMRARFTSAGIDAGRLEFIGRTDWLGHMAAYDRVDIALDTFPQTGGATTLEGLMMGVPAITLRWPTRSGRGSASIQNAIGLEDWIAESEDDYLELAVRKSKDIETLAALRATLRERFMASPLGDAQGYARAFESHYREMWKSWVKQHSDAA